MTEAINLMGIQSGSTECKANEAVFYSGSFGEITYLYFGY